MVASDVLRRIPKVELHCHLEGSIRASTLAALAQHHGVALPGRDGRAFHRFADRTELLTVYEAACDVMRSASDFALVTYEALEDASMSSNVRYREMFFNPSLHPGTPYSVMLAGILDGARAAEHDYGIRCRLIPSIHRQMPITSAMEMVDLVVRHRDDRVVGIGMDGDELLDPPEQFAAVYAAAGRAGLHRSAHVAHDGPASFIVTCIEQLGVERIDHGYHVVDDAALTARLRDSGIAFLCATQTPPLCGWPRDLDESPVRRMIDDGLTVVLNSDDPTMLQTDLGLEFERVVNGWGHTPTRTKQFVMDAVGAAWCDDTERRELRRDIEPELDRLLGLGAATARYPDHHGERRPQ